jgi:hypothetical protein
VAAGGLHLIQVCIIVKNRAKSIYVLDKNFASAAYLQLRTSISKELFFSTFLSARHVNHTTAYLHLALKRTFSKKLALAQNADANDEEWSG